MVFIGKVEHEDSENSSNWKASYLDRIIAFHVAFRSITADLAS